MVKIVLKVYYIICIVLIFVLQNDNKMKEEKKMISFRVALSRVDEIRNLVYTYLDGKIEVKDTNKVHKATSGHESTGVGVNSLDITNIPASNTFKWLTENADARYKPVNYNESIAYECGCSFSNGLFHRKKGCGLTKVQHTNLNANNITNKKSKHLKM